MTDASEQPKQVCIGIGNSDDKLTQRGWADFIGAIDFEIAAEHCQIHGRWFSAPDSAFQNAGFLIDRPVDVESMKRHLASIAGRYRQDSIAWLEGETAFLEASR